VDDELVTRTGIAAGNYLSFAFGPYVKQWQGQPPPNDQLATFNSYGKGDASVANQIALVGPYTTQLATYSAGYAGYYPPSTPYNQVDSNWMVGIAAAQYNAQKKALAVVVSQGIYQQADDAHQRAEIEGAFSIAAAANAAYPGSVKRLIFTNEYVTDAATTSQVLALINQYSDRAHKAGLEVGVRSNTFGNLTAAASPYKSALESLVKAVDFIMLNIYPSETASRQGIPVAVDEVSRVYHSIKTPAVALNAKLQVLIGETGWPSMGLSFNNPSGDLNSVANEQAYYTALRTWANANNVETFFFEAIDEPWKSNQNQDPNAPNFWQGPNGAEGHYGIWTYSGTGDSGQFTAKFTPIKAS
jgi:glucan 1,3-beta-glucosidase